MRKLLLIMLFCFANHCFAMTKETINAIAIPKGFVLNAKYSKQQYLTGINDPLISTGEIILWNDKGLLWQVLQPFANAIFFTKNGFYQIISGEKVLKQEAQKSVIGGKVFNAIATILNGSFVKDVNGFVVNELPTGSENKWRVKLDPVHNKIKEFIESIIVEGEPQISMVIINRQNGDRDEITLKDHNIFNGAEFSKNLTKQQLRLFSDD